MPARGGDLKGALDVLLPLDVGKIRQRTHVLPGSRRLRGLYLLLAAQMAQQLAHVLHRVYGYILGKGGFIRVLGRDKQLTHTLACRGKRHWQRALNRAQLTEQGQLADKGRVAPGRVNVPRGGKDADEYRQVIDRPGFLFIRGREVHSEPADREAEAVILYRSAHTLARLLDGSIRKTDDVKARKPVRYVYLDLDAVAADAADAEAVDARKHTPSSPAAHG